MAYPNTLTNGTLADADDVMANFDYVEDEHNEKGILVETISATSVASVTTASITACDKIIIEGYVIGPVGGAPSFQMRLNGDTGSNYSYTVTETTTPGIANSSGTEIGICGCDGNVFHPFRVEIGGRSPAITNGQISIVGSAGNNNAGNGFALLSGRWTAGNAVNVSTVTFLVNTGSITEIKAKVYRVVY